MLYVQYESLNLLLPQLHPLTHAQFVNNINGRPTIRGVRKKAVVSWIRIYHAGGYGPVLSVNNHSRA